MADQFDQIPEIAAGWLEQGRQVALATVIETWGSAPRRVGAQLVIDAAGSFEGSVSGGCVEGAVVTEAEDVLATGACRVLTFGVADNDAFAAGLACGGTIRILLEPIGFGEGPTRAEFAALLAARVERRAVALSVDLATWQRRMIFADAPGLAAEMITRFKADKSGEAEGTFVAIHNPPKRLIIIGAVHIAQALVPMARLVGFDVTLADPRSGFASAARFPDLNIPEDWPDEVVTAARPDQRTALVTLAHYPKIDDPAILAALASPAFYIGCLGSRRTHAKRLERLRDAGVGEHDLRRIHGPAGLDIGAQTPAEIAASILAEMIDALRKEQGG